MSNALLFGILILRTLHVANVSHLQEVGLFYDAWVLFHFHDEILLLQSKELAAGGDDPHRFLCQLDLILCRLLVRSKLKEILDYQHAQ